MKSTKLLISIVVLLTVAFHALGQDGLSKIELLASSKNADKRADAAYFLKDFWGISFSAEGEFSKGVYVLTKLLQDSDFKVRDQAVQSAGVLAMNLKNNVQNGAIISREEISSIVDALNDSARGAPPELEQSIRFVQKQFNELRSQKTNPNHEVPDKE